MFHAPKAIGPCGVLLYVIGMGGCAAAPAPSPDALDSRLTWPCSRLAMAWTADTSQLQALLDANVKQRNNDGVGKLQLSVMRCDRPLTSRGNNVPLLYATVTVAITADSTPLTITRAPEDGWWALPRIVADTNTSALFARMGFEVLEADISFDVERSAAEIEITARLNLPNGHILASARVAGNPEPHDASLALLEYGDDSWSTFFGPERGERYSSVSVILKNEGDTPLSMFNLPETPAMALFDAGLVSDRVLWRLPIIQE